MAELELPPFLRALVDQDDARNRDLLDAALTLYRQHAEQVHDGDPSPCGRAFVMCRHLGMADAPALSQHECNGLLAYAVERIFKLSHELASLDTALAELKAATARLDAETDRLNGVLGRCADCGAAVRPEDPHTEAGPPARVWCGRCAGLVTGGGR